MAKPATKSAAMWVLRRLHKDGYQALFAGGCVRDMLLGVRCSDYDIATNATPMQVKRLFPHVLLIGAKFGVAMVIHRGRKIEVTTFRSDLSYTDGRRPEGVRFATARQDAQRRDFTINGMFYDPLTDEIIDYVGGRRDLADGIVRTIGSASQRFAEDHLRMLRAVRFAMRLGFSIAEKTIVAIRKNAPMITTISGERIFDELGKMLSVSSAPQALKMLEELGLAQEVLPELFESKQHWPTVMERTAVLAKRQDLTLMLAAVLADLSNRTIRNIVRRWGAPNALRDGLLFLSQNLNLWAKASEMPLCNFKRLMANIHFDRLVAMWRAQECLSGGSGRLSRLAARRAAAIPRAQVQPAPLVTGEKLKKLGLKEGPALGKALRAVYDAQLNEVIHTQNEAIDMVKKTLLKKRR